MIKKYKITFFYIFTFLFTIILAGASQNIPLNIPQKHQLLIFLLLVQIAPTLGTILVCLITKDWSVWKNMNWNFFDNKKNILWLIIAILIPTIIILSSSFIMSIFGYNYISNEYSNQFIIILIFVSLIGSIGEEIGWRGYMLPSFNRKYSLFKASIFTGILWGAWHIGKIMDSGIIGYILFILLITQFSVIMGWIYSKSSAKMINMVFFHIGINVFSIMLLTDREGIMFYIISIIISAIIILVIGLTDKKIIKKLRMKQSQ